MHISAQITWVQLQYPDLNIRTPLKAKADPTLPVAI